MILLLNYLATCQFNVMTHLVFLDKERYGYQMLEKMGWADGRGLGKEQRGNVSHVKIKKRKGNVGIYLRLMFWYLVSGQIARSACKYVTQPYL